MTHKRRLFQLLALFCAFAIIAAACGDSDDDEGGDTGDSTTTEASSETTEGDAGGTTETSEGDTTESTEAAGDAAMTLTIDLNPEAVWSDGDPITWEDLECTWRARIGTPGVISVTGYDRITGVSMGESESQAVITFDRVWAPYKDLFDRIVPAHSVANCDDISADMQTEYPVSGRPYQLDSFGPDQLILTANPNYYGPEEPIAQRIVEVPRTDDGGVAALQAGEVDFIFPQAFAGITDALAQDNVTYVPGYGTNYEVLYFSEREGGPFADDAFRHGFSMSVDRDLMLANIYDPIFPGAPLLNCGFWVPNIGPWCDNTQFENSFDPAAAATLLEGEGWTKNADGFWEKDGVVPEIRWMVNEPNQRRASAQALMIPEFAKQGFNVVADNGDAATVFQQRLPAGDYDLGMFINTASPDPSVTPLLHCDSIATPENNNVGQNFAFWCNEEASGLMDAADSELDEAARTDLTHQIGQMIVDDAVMLPLFQFPNIAAWRNDALEGDTPGSGAENYHGFAYNMHEWQPTDGDEITIGAEQWPDCINPITECANSSWAVWLASFAALPALWDPTNDGGYAPTALLASEPVAQVG